MKTLSQQLDEQAFGNDYTLIDGVRMRNEHGRQFQIPPPVIKRHVVGGQFVEVRIDSPRFSMHDEDAIHCACPNCDGELAKPILRHQHPVSLLDEPSAQAMRKQRLPSRGWGEDFWVQVERREGEVLAARVDSFLCESRLHGISYQSTILLREEHILAVHDVHRLQLVGGMSAEDLKELAQWLRENSLET